MRRTAIPLLLAAALLLAVASPVEAESGHRSPTGAAKSGKEDKEAKENATEPRIPRGRPDAPAPIGAFSVEPSQRKASGDFVTFHYNETGIEDFTTQGVTLFDLQVQDVETKGGTRGALSRGAEFRLETPAFHMRAHDNPHGVTRVETDGRIAMTFVPGAELVLLGKERASFAVGNLSGGVRGDNLTLKGDVLTSDQKVLVYLEEARGPVDMHRKAIGGAIGRGHVGAEASFNKAEGEGVQEDVVSYGNVTMKTLKAERGNLTVLVEGHGFEGRVLVLNVDGRILGASKADQLHLLFDNETMRPADSLTDVLDPDDDGLMPEYYVVFDTGIEAFQLLVSVPHYSVHTLSVTTSLADLVKPSVLVGIVAGVALLVPTALLLFRRK